MSTKQLYEKLNGPSKKSKYDLLRFPYDVDVIDSRNIMLININAVEGSKSSSRSGVRIIEGETPTYRQQGSGTILSQITTNTRRISTAIALYMPSNISTSYGTDWSTSELGSLGAAASIGSTISDTSNMSEAKDVYNNDVKEILKQMGINMVASLGSNIGVDLKSVKNLAQRKIDNPYMEVMFNGVKNRSFSFTFKMVPRNRKESEQIREIVKTLKYHQAPEVKAQGANNYWLYPSEFEISFLHKDQENPYLFKVSTCALTDLSVTQGGDAYFSTFDDGAPFSTEITMSFLEMEVLTKDRILEGGF